MIPSPAGLRSPAPSRLPARGGQRGFALVVALSLMAFVLLLLLATTTLVQVETSASTTQKETLRARQNALLGAMIALGELRKAAGPDRRATGTAALLDENPATPEIDGVTQPHWTGVWNPGDPANPTWLVSVADRTDPPDPTEPLTADEVELVGANSAAETVRVAEAEVEDGGADRYAWWVGDEGVKAKINTANPYLDATTDEEKALSLQVAQRAAAELVDDEEDDFIGSRFDPADSATQADFARIRGLPELPLSDPDLWNEALLRERFHDLTLASTGLLADSAEGGLRRDLNLAFEMDLDDFNADATFAAGGEQPPPLSAHDIRYVFEETNSDRVRGPTWHLLRNYYRLYKANDPDRAAKENHQRGVRDAAGDPVIRGRPHYVGDTYFRPRNWANERQDMLTAELGDGSNEATRPTAMQIAPVYLRRQLVFSLEAEEQPKTDPTDDTEYKLTLHIDPVETLWNPYNVALEFSDLRSGWSWINLVAEFTVDRPGDPPVTIRTNLEDLGDVRQDGGFLSLETRLNAQAEGGGSQAQRTVRMEPGEILVFSNTEGETETFTAYGKTLTRIFLGPGLGDGANNIQDSEGYSSTQLDSENELGRGGEIIIPENTTVRLRISGNNDRPMLSSIHFMDVSDNQYAMFSRLFFEGAIERPDLSWMVQEPPPLGLLPVPGTPRKTPVVALQIQLKAEDAEDPVPLFAHGNPFAGGIAPFTDGAGYEEGPDAFETGLRPITSWNNDLISIDPSTDRGFWGPSHEDPDISLIPAVELPTAPLLSLGTLQNVHVAMQPHQPAFAVASSDASPYIPRDRVRHLLPTDRGDRTQIDYSYLMNEALFDRYFFSSLAPRPLAPAAPTLEEVLDAALADPEGRLPNTRMRLVPGEDETGADLRDKLLKSDGSPTPDAYRRIAENLVIDGAFNVNSTSVEAWKAVLAGTNGSDVVYRGGEEANAESPLTRYRVPPGPSGEEWRGFNTLSPDEIEDLAEAVVREVKTRFAQSAAEPAPFFGVADFVNRALATNETGLKGALQAAIDRTDINDGFSKGYRTEDRTDLGNTDFIHPEALHGHVAAGAPGFLSQRDLLVPLGPTLAARSDTFRIRAQGARANPATGDRAEAWCELLVQRTPEKVDPTEPVETEADGFGRRFVILDFRWLSPDEV